MRLSLPASLVLFCFSTLVSTSAACDSAEARDNAEDLKWKIEFVANMTIFQIKVIKERILQDSQITMDPPASPPIQGLASLQDYLAFLNRQMQSSGFDFLDQIQANVSTLGDHVGELNQVLGCPRWVQGPGDLQSQRAPGNFRESHCLQSLEMVQRYMEKLTLNMDKLSVC